MPYLSGSAQAQLGALPLGLVGWTLQAVSLGLVEWRVWIFPRSASASAGVAWVGLWRACFHTHDEDRVTPGLRIMRCCPIRLRDAFTPPEIAAAQVLMLLALGMGLLGLASGLYALRNAFFGVEARTRLAFRVAGVAGLAAAILALATLLWNLVAVARGWTIEFPPEFQLPEHPEAQQVGGAVWAGLVGVALQGVATVVFISYRLPKNRSSLRHKEGKDNPAFEFEDVWL